MILSVIIPVYNVERYLAECLDSVCAQTLKDIEIICIDDGSTDGSAAILDDYARCDPRLRVIKQANAGLSAARNRGLDIATGRYVYFIDSDDGLADENALATLYETAEREQTDIIYFDAKCMIEDNIRGRTSYNERTYLRTHSYSGVKTGVALANEFVANGEYLASACLVFLRRQFLNDHAIRFVEGILHEDNAFALECALAAKRAMCLPAPYYARRVRKDSIVTAKKSFRHLYGFLVCYKVAHDAVKKYASSSDAQTFIAWQLRRCALQIRHLTRLVEDADTIAKASLTKSEYALYEEALAAKTERLNPFQRLVKCFHDEGFWYTLQRLLVLGRRNPQKTRHGERISRCLHQIEEARQKTTPDLYLVTGQINSTTNEAIDSWTFFTWLQAHNVPSRYLIWCEHRLYRKLLREGKTKDVVALRGDGCKDDEILFEHSELLVRARAVVQENVALNPMLRQWIVNLPNCERVFLQHGVTFWECTKSAAKNFAENNIVNVSSVREKRFIEDHVLAHSDVETVPRFVIAGLPRYDLLKDAREPSQSDFVLFVMFTRRASFAQSARRSPEEQRKRIQGSAYARNIRHFLRAENIRRLKASNVRIVLSVHHDILNAIPDFVLAEGVEMISPSLVSHWIRRADACLTDFSSVSFDFAFQHKPTFYWIPDWGDTALDERDRERCQSAQMQLRQLYNVADTEENALSLIESYAEKNFVLEPEKCALADTFFAYKKDVCRHIYEGIEEIIKERQNEWRDIRQ